jgi:hypothetical protein
MPQCHSDTVPHMDARNSYSVLLIAWALKAAMDATQFVSDAVIGVAGSREWVTHNGSWRLRGVSRFLPTAIVIHAVLKHINISDQDASCDLWKRRYTQQPARFGLLGHRGFSTNRFQNNVSWFRAQSLIDNCWRLEWRYDRSFFTIKNSWLKKSTCLLSVIQICTRNMYHYFTVLCSISVWLWSIIFLKIVSVRRFKSWPNSIFIFSNRSFIRSIQNVFNLRWLFIAQFWPLGDQACQSICLFAFCLSPRHNHWSRFAAVWYWPNWFENIRAGMW